MIIQKIVGHTGKIIWDDTLPDGTTRKLMDVLKMHNLECKCKVNLEEGIQKTYDWFLENVNQYKQVKM